MDLNQITLAVTSLDRSIEFYRKLGLKLIVNSPDSHYARFECPDGGATFSIHEVEEVGPCSASVYFEVENVDSTVDELKKSGLTFETGPIDQSWLWREAWTLDPDGHRIGIYHAGANRRFPPWRVED